MGGVTRGSSPSRLRAVVAAAVLAATLLGPAGPAAAEQGDSFLGDVGVGFGTALVNLLYIPAKFTYATVGSVIGGLAWCLTLGDTDTAMGVWEPTLGGSYVITPDMLRGKDPIEFSGTTTITAGSGDETQNRQDDTIKEYDAAPPAR
jgi:hypothetical protein